MGKSLSKNYLNINKNRTWIVGSTCSIFFPRAPLAPFGFEQFLLWRTFFFRNCSPPPKTKMVLCIHSLVLPRAKFAIFVCKLSINLSDFKHMRDKNWVLLGKLLIFPSMFCLRSRWRTDGSSSVNSAAACLPCADSWWESAVWKSLHTTPPPWG